MNDKTIYLVLDLVRGGELFERILKNEFFNEKDASEVTRQVCPAMVAVRVRADGCILVCSCWKR
jgi:serine/threonine protein kinase